MLIEQVKRWRIRCCRLSLRLQVAARREEIINLHEQEYHAMHKIWYSMQQNPVRAGKTANPVEAGHMLREGLTVYARESLPI